MKFIAIKYVAILFFVLAVAPAHAATRPILLELFTSQGCSSCPPAETLLKSLSAEPGVLALTLHVQYWDHLGWKDPYALELSTLRQRAYGQVLHEGLYTPQIIIDGASVTDGNDRDGIKTAMRFAKNSLPAVPITLTPSPGWLRVTLPEAPLDAGVTIPVVATLWAMQYRESTSTDIRAGENRGKKLEGLHDVVQITKLGEWSRDAMTFDINTSTLGNDHIAFILQGESFGRVAGVATYP